MANRAGRRQPFEAKHTSKAQALVELAIVMPLLVGIIAVLFQFGILFIAYLSLVHEGRDIGRFAAVHPDTIDGTDCTTAASMWKQVCDDAPSVIDPNRITQTILPACVSLSAGRCANRTAGSQLHVTLNYDASGSIIFLPTTFRLGPWLTVSIPTALPPYDYYVMVETH